jgi:hypothetical protein
LQTVVRDRRPRKIAAQMFQAVVIVGAHAHVGVYVETGRAS